jgi:ELWxxDGT repeat protein
VFQGSDGTTGREPFTSDGTAAGTVLIADLGGSLSSTPRSFTTAGSTVFFAALDNRGDELWAMPLGATGAALLEYYGAGCPGTGGLVPVIGATGTPQLGNAGFALTLANARASAPAAVLAGFARTRFPLGGQCFLLVDAPLLGFSVAVGGTGTGTFPISIPSDPTLQGDAFFFQFVVADPAGAAIGLAAMSGGLLAVVGR